MKKVEYFCNLCGENRDKKDLKNLYFNPTTTQNYVLLENEWDKSDKHICTNCIGIIQARQ